MKVKHGRILVAGGLATGALVAALATPNPASASPGDPHVDIAGYVTCTPANVPQQVTFSTAQEKVEARVLSYGIPIGIYGVHLSQVPSTGTVATVTVHCSLIGSSQTYQKTVKVERPLISRVRFLILNITPY